MNPKVAPTGSRLKSLSGKACPLCGGTDIAWSWVTWLKVLLALPLFGFIVFLPILRRCRTCNLTFKAPMAGLFR